MTDKTKELLNIVVSIIKSNELRNNLNLTKIQDEILHNIEYMDFNYNLDSGFFKFDNGINVHAPSGKFKFISFENFLNISICDFVSAVKKDDLLNSFISEEENYRCSLDNDICECECEKSFRVMFRLKDYKFQFSYRKNKGSTKVSLRIPG